MLYKLQIKVIMDLEVKFFLKIEVKKLLIKFDVDLDLLMNLSNQIIHIHLEE
jgi:hypothetical protein